VIPVSIYSTIISLKEVDTMARKKTRRRSSSGSLFGTPVRSKRRAQIVSIKTPTAFKKSIATLRKGRYTLADQRALVLARNRAGAQLKRRNLSRTERSQMSRIVRISIPTAGKKPRR